MSEPGDDTSSSAADTMDSAGASTSARRVPIEWWLAGAAAIAVYAVRWFTSRQRRIFALTPDEPGQLAIARYLGQGVARWNMFDHSTWRPAFGTLLAPITWFTDDPTTGFRVALVVNALLGAVAFWLLYRLALRLTSLSAPWCVAAALVVSLGPATLFVANYVWSESLAQVMFLGFALSALSFQDRPRWTAAAAMIATAAGGYTTHGRMLTLAISLVMIAVWAALWRRWPLIHCALLVAGAAVATRLSEWYFHLLVDRIWETPAETNTVQAVREQLKHRPQILVELVGQSWYALVTTAGLVGIGLVWAVVRALNRGSDRPAVGQARTVLVAVLPLVGLSIVFMAGRPRPDHAVYGRYIDVALTPLVLIGIGAVVTASRRFVLTASATTIAAMVGATWLLDARRQLQLEAGGWVRPMTLGLVALAGGPRHILVWQILAVGLGAMVLVVGVTVTARSLASGPTTRWAGPAALTAVVIVLAAAGYARARPVLDGSLNSWARAAPVQEIVPDLVPAGTPIRYHLVSNNENPSANVSTQRQRRQIFQFYLPYTPIYLDDPASFGTNEAAAASPFVFAPDNTRDLLDAGYEIIWRDRTGMALFEAPAS